MIWISNHILYISMADVDLFIRWGQGVKTFLGPLGLKFPQKRRGRKKKFCPQGGSTTADTFIIKVCLNQHCMFMYVIYPTACVIPLLITISPVPKFSFSWDH